MEKNINQSQFDGKVFHIEIRCESQQSLTHL